MISKRRKWVLILLGVIAVVTSVAYLTRDPEPTYQGKPLSYWILVNSGDALESTPEDERLSATAIRSIGSNAVPFLVQWIQFEGEESATHIRRLVAHLPSRFVPNSVWQWAHTRQRSARSHAASEAFYVLASAAEAAIPELTALMNDRSLTNTSLAAVRALGGIGPKALPVLMAQLANTNAPNRDRVTVTLGTSTNIPKDTNMVLPLLIRTLKDPDDGVAWWAAVILSHIITTNDSPPLQILSTLTNNLGPEVPVTLRARTAYLLGYYGETARPYLPTLLHWANDPNNLVREKATNALRQIAPEALTNAPPRF